MSRPEVELDDAAWWIVGLENQMIAGPFERENSARWEMDSPHGEDNKDYYYQWGTPSVMYGVMDWEVGKVVGQF